ncbi:beta-secretase 2-like [Sycon ciliatum]|uniref:beta-secretase 2-like n=1 Tax=Sycon ciliatum TaxID=27933 RepID=UPI0031F6C5ED
MALRELLLLSLCGLNAVYVCHARTVSKLSGTTFSGYNLDIGLGTPTQRLRVLVDTASTDFPIATSANSDPASKLSTYFDTSQSSSFGNQYTPVNRFYTNTSYWRGTLGLARVSLSTLKPVSAWMVAVYDSKNFFLPEWQGALGLAPSVSGDLAQGGQVHQSTFSAFYDVGRVFFNKFSLQLCGVSQQGSTTTQGNLVWGNNLKSLYTGPILYTPYVPATLYVVAVNHIAVNGVKVTATASNDSATVTTNNTTLTAVLDSATTGLRFPATGLYQQVVSSIRNSTMMNTDSDFRRTVALCTQSDDFWRGSVSCCISIGTNSSELFGGFPNISIAIPQAVWYLAEPKEFLLTVTPQLYLVPTRVSSAPRKCYRFSISASDNDALVFGTGLLEGYYVVFDREEKRIGFAASACPDLDPVLQKPGILGPYLTDGVTTAVHSSVTTAAATTSKPGPTPTTNTGTVPKCALVSAELCKRSSGSESKTSGIAIGVGVSFGGLLLLATFAALLVRMKRNADTYDLMDETEEKNIGPINGGAESLA